MTKNKLDIQGLDDIDFIHGDFLVRIDGLTGETATGSSGGTVDTAQNA